MINIKQCLTPTQQFKLKLAQERMYIKIRQQYTKGKATQRATA